MSEAVLNAAIHYSKIGLIVHSLSGPKDTKPSPGKRPLTKDWNSRNTPLSEEQIKSEFGSGEKNIGVVCGRISGIVVIDFDDMLFFEDLVQGMDTSDWIISTRTKEGENLSRCHVFFRYEEELPFRVAKGGKQTKLVGIDILGATSNGKGANCVLPPSVHSSGGIYHWIGKEPQTIEDIPPMPELFKKRLINFIQMENEIVSVAGKCRKWVMEFLQNPEALHGGSGRRCMVALIAEMKTNGLSDQGAMVISKVVYRDEYKQDMSEYQISKIECIPWTSERLCSEFSEYCNEKNTSGSRNKPCESAHIETSTQHSQDEVDWNKLAEAAVEGTEDVTNTSNMSQDEMYTFNLKNCVQIINDNTGECIINPTRASRIIMDQYHGFSYNGTVFIYNGTHYEKGEMRIRQEVCSCIQMNAGERIRSVSLQENNVITMCSHSYLELEYTFNRHPDLINCRNGVVKIDLDTGTITLLPHSHEYRFDYCLPVNYDAEAEGSEIHELCISKWVSEEKEIEQLYQIPAQALIQKTNNKPFKKAHLIQGDPHGGKSTYLELLRKTFGDNMFSAQSLQDIAQDRFAISSLENKAFNAYDDLTDVPMAHVGKFKTLTGAYDHEIEAKYQPKRATKITAVHIFTCNAPPIVDDNVQRDTAFWERWEFIKFNSHFDVDPTFNDRMFSDQNLSGFLNRILQCIIKIHNNNRLVTISSVSEVREQWNLSADPLYEFIKENFDSTPTVMYLEKDKLLNALLQWARDNDKDMHKVPQTKTKLTRAIDKYMFHEKRIRNEQGIEIETYECHAGMWILNSKYQFAKVKLLQKQSRI